jgi:hypothetical protein
MPKVKISEYSATAADNTDINGIDIAEGCAPSGINDAIRTLMKQVKDFQTGAAGDSLTVGGALNVTGTATLTTVDINGGFLDTITIGSSTPGAGTFTNLAATGTLNVTGSATLATVDINGGTIDGVTIGGSATGAATFTTASAGTGSFTVLSDGGGSVRQIPQSGAAKTASYTLATTDVGDFILLSTGSSVTIPNSTFAAGDAVSMFNNTTGDITITCSTTLTYIGGTDSDKATVALKTRGVATVLFIDGTTSVITGNVS